MNWYIPGEVLVTVPITVQLLKGKTTFVVDRTVKDAPGVLVKENWQAPLVST